MSRSHELYSLFKVLLHILFSLYQYARSSVKLQQIENIHQKINSSGELNLSHCGHVGDIINALPVIKELSKKHLCNLFVKINTPLNVYYHKHPSDNVFINKETYMKLLPLFCSDGNLRSHKEKRADGWKTQYDNQSINHMLNISNQQIHESYQQIVPISGKERTKVYKEVKRDNHQNKLVKGFLMDSIIEK